MNATTGPGLNWTEVHTDYQIKGRAYFQIAWCALTLLICLPGNTLILVASVKYKALKLDKVSIVLIENIAVADLGVSLFVVLPRMVSVIAAGWDYACDVTGLSLLLFPVVSILSVTALNISKLTCLLSPLMARMRTHTQGRIIAASLWACAVLVIALLEVVSFLKVGVPVGTSYSYNTHMCVVWVYKDVAGLYTAIIALFTLLPMLVIVVTTIWLMVYVQKVRGSLSKEGVVTLIAISLVFIVSFIPMGTKSIVFWLLSKLLGGMEYEDWYNLVNAINAYYTELSLSVPYLNCMANPIIYLFTVTSFKTFVVEMLRGWRTVLRHKYSHVQ